MQELDRWALARLGKLVAGVRASYEKYEYHTIYHNIHNFCAVDMSNFYLDIIKDRLYCDEAYGLSRRSAQTVIYLVLDALVRMLAPILAFTTEEIWAAMPHHDGVETDSVLYNSMPEPVAERDFSPEREAMWDKAMRLRTDVNKALEIARADKVIGKPLEAEVTLFVGDSASAAFDEVAGLDLKSLFIVSGVEVVRGAAETSGAGDGYAGVELPSLTVLVKASAFPKCARCWTHDMAVGDSAEHPELCPRCLDVVVSGRWSLETLG